MKYSVVLLKAEENLVGLIQCSIQMTAMNGSEAVVHLCLYQWITLTKYLKKKRLYIYIFTQNRTRAICKPACKHLVYV